ncbi:MAG: kinase [Panacagrimonas sp.]|jgi:NAD+ kinase|nr:NAD(+) kinase [Panacagrimonas sp.]MCC2657252.1 kinase [Panacagrimonas sp.]
MSPFRVVGVIGKRREPNLDLLRDLCDGLRRLGCEVLIEANGAFGRDAPAPTVARDELARRCELVIVVGGDGTLLDAGRDLAPAQVPLLGVNQGRLGFMTDVAPESMHEHLAAIVHGQYESEDRLLLSASVERNGRRDGATRLAVNDVVIRNQATIRMIEFETWLDHEFISNHRADGVIVASPTGSTAYALSGGGPLLHPSLSAIALVPICPHTLSDRPIVVDGQRPIRIVIRGVDRAQAMVTFDGQTSETLEPGDVVEVRRAEKALRLIHPPGYSYFRILRDKLRWGSGPAAQERV